MTNRLRKSHAARPVVFLAFIFLLGIAAHAQQQNAVGVATSYRPRAIVIGFMGGKVAPNDVIRNELVISKRLRASYPQDAYFGVFENRRLEDAHDVVTQILARERRI